ncbi:MAG: glycosyltransferase [Pseudomonadota bacterium]
MEQLLLSFIVPVFDSASYLNQCLDSILDSNRSDIEVICIDDASTDDSARILKEYRSRDPRVRVVFRQSNSGISSTRNLGLQLAQGSHVYFVDSDDWVDSAFFEKIPPLLAKGVDVVCINAFRHSHKGARPIYRMPIVMQGSGIEWMTARCVGRRFWDHSMWLYCYRKEFLLQIGVAFPVLENMRAISVDYPWNFKILLKARKLISIDDCLYHYRVRENSTTTAKGRGYIHRRLISWSSYLAELEPLVDATEMQDHQRRLIESNLVERALSILKYFRKLDLVERRQVFPVIRPALRLSLKARLIRHRARIAFERLQLRLSGFRADQ